MCLALLNLRTKFFVKGCMCLTLLALRVESFGDDYACP